MGTGEFSLKAIKDAMHNKVTKRMHLTFYLNERVSAVEGATDVSFQGTSTFEVEVKDAIEVTTELHLKMHMAVPC